MSADDTSAADRLTACPGQFLRRHLPPPVPHTSSVADWRLDVAEALGTSELLRAAVRLGCRWGEGAPVGQVDEAKRALRAQIEQHRAEQARCANDAVRLAERVAELERELWTARNEVDDLRSWVDPLAVAIKDAREQRDAARIEAAELRQVAASRAETIGQLRTWVNEARGLANRNAIDRDTARAERDEARAELAQFVGPYSSWHILVSHRTDGSVGLTLAGAGPLIEKLARVADFRQERPDVGAWRIDRCETWTRRLPEPDPARALMDAMPGLTAEGAAEILADLARPGVETETSTETEEVTQS